MSGRQDATSQAPADACGPIAAVGQHRNPASRLDETLSPARLSAASGTHQTQARALRLRDDRRPPAGGREIAAVSGAQDQAKRAAGRRRDGSPRRLPGPVRAESRSFADGGLVTAATVLAPGQKLRVIKFGG
jgi:hypothetical protein